MKQILAKLYTAHWKKTKFAKIPATAIGLSARN